MPELPEVETTARGIAPHITGQVIKAVIVRQPSLRWPVPKALASVLTGQKIQGVSRRGKYLLLEAGSGHVLVHLGMSGNLRMVDASEEVRKHDHVDFVLGNALTLRFHDPRRFGCILWEAGDINAHPLLCKLGPEPLTEAFDGDLLFQLSRKRSAPVKQFIMDSHIVVGVGNIYANEALYLSGISPLRKAGSISRARYLKLGENIKAVLARAIIAGGTTLRDFIGGDGKPGYFKQSLNVYGRGELPCLVCNTPLKEVRLGQRTTVFCPKCQR